MQKAKIVAVRPYLVHFLWEMGHHSVDKTDGLQGFAQTHAVSQNSSSRKAPLLDVLLGLENGVPHEFDASALMRLQLLGQQRVNLKKKQS